MATYAIYDIETSIYESHGRKANPFDERNYIVSHGVKYSDGRYILTHINEEGNSSLPSGWLDGVDCIVGINLKFDLLYMWDDPEVKAFFKRGGRIYDCQYARYLATAQQHKWASMNDMAAIYGGTQKEDKIKEYWQNGVQTIDIPKNELIDYLKDDLDNTEVIFKGLLKETREKKMTKTIKHHMDGLLATTEMEYNGLYIDMSIAKKNMAILEEELERIAEKLKQYEPEMPEGTEFNWGSGDHLSALLFGGKIPCTTKQPVFDDDGNQVFFFTTETQVVKDARGNPIVFKTGKNVGKPKTRKVKVYDKDRPKYRNTTTYVETKGMAKPKKEWALAKEGVYKTDAKVIKALADKGNPFASDLLTWKKYEKDLGTYYKRGNKGMLMMVQADGRIHHSLNNVQTETGRLSSSKPNLQNCYDDKTEVLTNNGWKLFGELTREDEVAQWNADGSIEFVMPSSYVQYHYVGDMVRLSGDAVNMLVTPEHRMVSKTRKGSLMIETAQTYLDKWLGTNIVDRKIVRGGEISGGIKLNAQQRQELELACMIQAEGYLRSDWNVCEASFRSQRKQEQAQKLVSTKLRGKDGRTVAYIKMDDPAFKWLDVDVATSTKNFNTEVLRLCKEDMMFFLECVMRWDGDFTRGCTYHQQPKQIPSVDIVQAVATLCGKSTSIYSREIGNTINVNRNTERFLSRVAISREEYTGMVYCVTVPSSMIIVRREGSVIVSGNCPRGNTSNVREMFCSRFGDDGVMAEIDYSQLEVVVQAFLTKDANMIRDVNDKVDFHCKRLAYKLHEDYATVVQKAKVEKDPWYDLQRTLAKGFSFQRAFGAGKKAIAASTGMDEDEVQKLIDVEDKLYPNVLKYNAWVAATVEATAKPTNEFTFNGHRRHVGWHPAPTGKRYSFKTYDAPEFLEKSTSFSPTEQKNYSVQGSAGEMVLISIGRLWRRFVETDNYGGRAFLVNTVHDCVWFDMHKDVINDVVKDAERVMTAIPENYEKMFGIDVPVVFRVDSEVGVNMKDLEHYDVKGD